ncbi:ankyrin repeat domain-containing protein 33B isoform X2 [Gadus morhua]|uniref:Ankyrin repeat domain 33ba n=1 Tax=Gadus morhua TaxID=8049 RepID=A0A8C4ZCV5_GADMO|nr:ankyrin repeat domain-containing protein 33B-like isoform X2 [Gadus morhua]
MVLITDDRDGGSSSTRGKHAPHLQSAQQQQKAPAGRSIAHVHPVIAPGSDQDHTYLSSLRESDELEDEGDEDNDDDEFEEIDFEDLDDSRSIASDDSFYPPEDDVFGGTPSPEFAEPLSLYQACCTNNAAVVRIMVRQGVDEEEVRRSDRNHRTGLLVACYQGYVDVVIALSQCPYLDVNSQDTEGNTALITAAQAGHILITSYLLNYFTGLDLERRNCHGFTALMKAAMQGRLECVRALTMAGADLSSRDYGRSFTPREWAVFTGRHETAWLMARLMERPCPLQLSDTYSLEWPKLAPLVLKAKENRGCLRRLSDTVRQAFNIANVTDPEDQGVIDHLVTVTTAMRSPFIALACRTVCPESPPCVGKRRHAVPEILRRQRAKDLRLNPERLDADLRLFQNSRLTLVAKGSAERRASLQPQALPDRWPSLSAAPAAASATAASGAAAAGNAVELRRTSLLPIHLMLRRSSVRPGHSVPKVRVSKAPAPTYEPEKVRRRSSGSRNSPDGRCLLQIPKWRYKELKEERRRAEEAERRRLEAASEKQLVTAARGNK